MEEDTTEPFLKKKNDDKAERQKKILKETITEEINNIMIKGFIKKVYGLLIFQILLTLGICIFAHYNKFFQYLLSFKTLLFLDVIIIIGMVILLLLKMNWFMKVPLNYFLLLIFTLAISWIVARESYEYHLKNLIISFSLTIITVVFITIYTLITKREVEFAKSILIVSSFLVLIAFVLYIFLKTSIFYLICNVFCLVIFSIYLIYDTELILTRSKGILVFADAYIPAVMIIYIDIVYTFLAFLGFSKN